MNENAILVMLSFLMQLNLFNKNANFKLVKKTFFILHNSSWSKIFT